MLLESYCPRVLIRILGWLNGATLSVSRASSLGRLSHTILEIPGIELFALE